MTATAAILTIVLLGVVVIGYAIVMYIMFKNKTYIFEPYTPNLPEGACNPLISVRKMTPDEIELRNQYYTSPSART